MDPIPTAITSARGAATERLSAQMRELQSNANRHHRLAEYFDNRRDHDPADIDVPFTAG